MKIHRLTTRDEPAFESLLRIYSEAHPASERKDVDALARMIERPEYLFLAGIEPDAVIGFAIVIAFANSDASLLEYMAVDVAHRGHHNGKQLFRAVADHALMSDRFLLVEVDSDRVPALDAEDRARRKSFYRRLGCRQIEGLTYVMPRVSTAEPPLMDLLMFRHDLPDAIEKSRLRRWLEDCYAQVYQLSMPDERIDAMLAEMPSVVSVR